MRVPPRFSADDTLRRPHRAVGHTDPLAHSRSILRGVARFPWRCRARKANAYPTARRTPGIVPHSMRREAAPRRAYHNSGSDTHTGASPPQPSQRVFAALSAAGVTPPRLLQRRRRIPPTHGCTVSTDIDPGRVVRTGADLGRSRARTSASARRGANSWAKSTIAAAAHPPNWPGFSPRAAAAAG